MEYLHGSREDLYKIDLGSPSCKTKMHFVARRRVSPCQCHGRLSTTQATLADSNMVTASGYNMCPPEI